MGLEPTTSGLEVQRAIHCATETADGFQLKHLLVDLNVNSECI